MDTHRRWIQALLVVVCLWIPGYMLYFQQTNPNASLFSAQIDRLWGIAVICIGSTIICALMIVAQLDIFCSLFNFTGRWSKILSDAAYTVYIVHPFFVVLM